MTTRDIRMHLAVLGSESEGTLISYNATASEETGELDNVTRGFLGICISFSLFNEKLKKRNPFWGIFRASVSRRDFFCIKSHCKHWFSCCSHASQCMRSLDLDLCMAKKRVDYFCNFCRKKRFPLE